jgi:NAD(P)-dependent dehydrogenase (short-subunit alcohol dehydrogenase family)
MRCWTAPVPARAARSSCASVSTQIRKTTHDPPGPQNRTDHRRHQRGQSRPCRHPLARQISLQGDSLTGLVQQIPLGRRGDPDEVAQAIVFLASDAGAFTVGSAFIIDGGMSTL